MTVPVYPDSGTEPQLYPDAVVFPSPTSRRPAGKLRIAVLDADGGVIPDAICGFHSITSAGYVPETTDAPQVLKGDWLFGGIASHHFGHQITRSLGRLAALGSGRTFDGIVYAHVDKRSADPASTAMFARLLDGLGITTPVLALAEPTRVQHLHIGPDQFSELTACRADPAYVTWARQIFLPAGIRPVRGSRLYVTRSRLAPTTGRILCEDILEQNLRAIGFEIFAPERHSVADQLRRYAATETIVTTDGSHAHLIALARQSGQKILMIARRNEKPAYILNHLESFGAGCENASLEYINTLVEEWWPSARSNNRSLGEVDFGALRAELGKHGLDDATQTADWITPSDDQLSHSKTAALQGGEWIMRQDERPEFLKWQKSQKGKSIMAGSPSSSLDVPKINGLQYHSMLKRMHEILKPNWYLEVGTFSGSSLTLVDCNYVAIDPNFKVSNPITAGSGTQMFLFQQPSDDFFDSGFLSKNKISIDFAFLDGLHEFEFLLRDFINTEKAMAEGGVITMHDCCPTDEGMAQRAFKRGSWTGDVWKTLLILLKYRPDLSIKVAAAAPTGLVVIENLDPKSKVLTKKYGNIIAEYGDLQLSDLEGGLAGLYQQFDLTPPAAVLAELEAR